MNGEIKNYKTRGLDGKFFTQSKDGESIIFNYDRCKGSDTIVICEGRNGFFVLGSSRYRIPHLC